MTRKITYISGTRADFGLMKKTLLAIQQNEEFDLNVLVTGMHLLPKYGNTHEEIDVCGLRILKKVHVQLSGISGAEMAFALADQIKQFTIALQELKPDILLLLGDRGEMLAGAISALHLKIPVVHIHGGERSGTIDEPMRHAITKLSHIHFAATEASRDRIIKMGERPDMVFTIGAPGLDEIVGVEPICKEELFKKYRVDVAKPLLLVLFHPVVQQEEEALKQASAVLEAVEKIKMQALILSPNADAGGESICRAIEQRIDNPDLTQLTHTPRKDYISLLSYSAAIIGNSSSGIIESASLGTPAVNVGDRQNGRERNKNIIDVDFNTENIYNGILRALSMQAESWENVYGDGTASKKIVELLANVELDSSIVEKLNTY